MLVGNVHDGWSSEECVTVEASHTPGRVYLMTRLFKESEMDWLTGIKHI